MRISHASVKLSSVRICLPAFIAYDYHPRRGLSDSIVNHYDILGLKPTASPSQIKSAYYQLSKKYHPDVAVDVDDAKEKFSKLSTAYEILSSPDKRALYDRSLHPSMARSATFRSSTSTRTGIDIEYAEFMWRRGAFRQRPSAQATPGSAGRSFDYDEFFRQQHYARMMRHNWEAQKNFRQRIRHQNEFSPFLTFWFLLFLSGAMSLFFGPYDG